MKVVIIGGVAGGATAAARIRRLDEKAQITIYERSSHVSYANCGLPYYIGGVIKNAADLALQTPESLWERFRIDVKVEHEVQRIHPDTKKVEVCNLCTGEVFIDTYDKLLLSTGAKPTWPNLPGMDSERLFSLRTVEDTLRIRQFVETHKPQSVVLTGGGYIGIEVAENLRDLGLEVTIIQRPKQLLNPLDYEMACIVHKEMRKKGVKLLLGHSVEGFSQTDEGILVQLKDQPSIQTDMVILAIGVTPDTILAKEAGLTLGIKESIVVNERMETSAKDIYAVGDAVQIKQYVTGEDTLISLAGPANKQGRIVADNICGGDSRYLGSQGSSVIKVFNLTVATTGINEQVALKSGIQYDKVYLTPMNHASYYPGGRIMNMKVLFEKDTYKLLGAQIIGHEGVDKRIDVLATAIQAGLTAIELKELDLSYAPPYSSAKDPVNMVGYMVDNIDKHRLLQYFWDEISQLPRDSSVTLLDIRTPEEYFYGHVDGYKNIPVDELRERIEELPKEKPVYLMCQSGIRSYIAYRILAQNGYTCYNFSGGYYLYEQIFS